MADNLKLVEERIDVEIDPTGAPGSVLAENHNAIEKEILRKTGKYVGSPFIAKKESTLFPSGTLSWNGNAMNNTSDFTITTSKLTADLIDIGRLLNTLEDGDIINFKDFCGRSVYLEFKSFVPGSDGSMNLVYNITVKGFSDNMNYIYQDLEIAICVLSFYKSVSKSYENIVYFDSTDPSTATIFDTENPPTINDDDLKSNDANLYVGTDSSTWVYNSSTLSYETKILNDSSNFYLKGTTTDAGNSKVADLETQGAVFAKGFNSSGAIPSLTNGGVYIAGLGTNDWAQIQAYIDSMGTPKALVINGNGGSVSIGTTVIGGSEKLKVAGTITATAGSSSNEVVVKSQLDDKASISYVDGLVVGLLDDRGNYDASTNLFPSAGGSGTAGAILKGDIWFISVSGTLGGQLVNVGDSVRALTDAPGQTSGNWDILESNIGYVPENTDNKSTDIESDKTSNIKFPTVKSIYDWCVGRFQPKLVQGSNIIIDNTNPLAPIISSTGADVSQDIETDKASTTKVSSVKQLYDWAVAKFTLKPIQVVSQTLTMANWTLVSGYYEYDLANANITATSIVDIVPDNASVPIVKVAEVLPKTLSGSGTVKMYSTKAPTGNIIVTINIWK